jgi:aldehyde:ferredoxin oxidoreductase
MVLPKGYAGKVAIINLTEQKAQIQPTEVFFREYGIDPRLWLGGMALSPRFYGRIFQNRLIP